MILTVYCTLLSGCHLCAYKTQHFGEDQVDPVASVYLKPYRSQILNVYFVMKPCQHFVKASENKMLPSLCRLPLFS